MNKISEEAQRQRKLAEGGDTAEPPTPRPEAEVPYPNSTTASSNDNASFDEARVPATPSKANETSSIVTSPSDVATSQSDVTKSKSGTRPAKELSGDTLGKGSRIDLDKLRTVIEEIAAVKTGAFGFSVRMSDREKADIEEFILDTLRREGIKGYEVSIAKLMRYAMRYMFRVHPQEFVTALRAALEVEETLSI